MGKYSNEEAIEILLKVHPEVTGTENNPYPGATITPWSGLKCGRGHEISPRLHRVITRPHQGVCDHSECGGNRELTNEEATARIRAVFPSIKPAELYRGSKENWLLHCEIHDEEVTSTYNRVFHFSVNPCHLCREAETQVFIYALVGIHRASGEFVTKVGVTRNLKRRLKEHRRFGFTSQPFMVFPTDFSNSHDVEIAVRQYVENDLGLTALGDKSSKNGYGDEAWIIGEVPPNQLLKIIRGITDTVLSNISTSFVAQAA